MAITVSPDALDGTTSCNTLFIDTSLDTHLAIAVSCLETVADLKKKILREHVICFPGIEGMQIHALKVKRNGYLYHLSESLLVKNAFEIDNKTWFLSADVSVVPGKTDAGPPNIIPIRRIAIPFDAHRPAPPSSIISPLPDGKCSARVTIADEDDPRGGSGEKRSKHNKTKPRAHGRSVDGPSTSSSFRANKLLTMKGKKSSQIGSLKKNDAVRDAAQDLCAEAVEDGQLHGLQSSGKRERKKRSSNSVTLAERDGERNETFRVPTRISQCPLDAVAGSCPSSISNNHFQPVMIPEHCAVTSCLPQHDAQESCKATSHHGRPAGDDGKLIKRQGASNLSKGSCRRGQSSEDQHDINVDATHPSPSAHEFDGSLVAEHEKPVVNECEQADTGEKRELSENIPINDEIDLKSKEIAASHETVDAEVLMQNKNKPRKPKNLTRKTMTVTGVDNIKSPSGGCALPETRKSVNEDQTSGMKDKNQSNLLREMKEDEDPIASALGSVPPQQIAIKQASPEAEGKQAQKRKGTKNQRGVLANSQEMYVEDAVETGNEVIDARQEACVVKDKLGKKKTRQLNVRGSSSSLRNSQGSPKLNKKHEIAQNMLVDASDTVLSGMKSPSFLSVAEKKTMEPAGVDHAPGKKRRDSEASREVNLRSAEGEDERSRAKRKTLEARTTETAAGLREKGPVEMSGAVFKDAKFVRSSENGSDDSGASTTTPSDNSLCSDNSNKEDNPDSNLMTTGSYAFKRRDIAGTSDTKPLCSVMTFDQLLRSSSRYKKARLMAYQDEEAVDFVPEIK